MSIKAVNLKYIYNAGTPAAITALDGVSIEVERGEWVSIVGHTGSGKSTLAQHLNLLLTPSSGAVSIDGATAAPGSRGARDARRKVGLVFQYPESQFFAETVREEIAFAPSNWGVAGSALDACVRDAASSAGLSESALGSNPFSLSGGERRRAAIASVLSMKPDYLVLDEPTAGLDASGVRGLTATFRELCSKGMAVIHVTHDMEIAMSMSDRIAVLERGVLVASGAGERVAEYLSEHPVKGLVMPASTRFAQGLREKGIGAPLAGSVNGIIKSLEEARSRLIR
ncbi:MAG: ATP-binding cassette domain-containing protein [Synergistaceae bacterium]|nr:ATP-binding cassette domain-containing protein [Synergistaceae bacterium]